MKLSIVIACCVVIPFVARGEQPPTHKKHAAKQQRHQVQTKTGHHKRATNNQTGVMTTEGQHHHGKDGSVDGQTVHENDALNQQQHHGKNASQVAGQHLNKKELKHFDLANKPNTKIESTKFQANHHIEGSEKWHGEKYVAFQNYHSEWHDRDWWHHHYDRVLLISGGWYFWNAGFWYPAWGYDSAYSYYPYDGPIYATSRNLPPDQVIANVQSALQEQGFYDGEVDGLLGPLTRAALADYQQAQGLTTTAAIDEPTLDALGLS
jgi:hypothetical protein